MPLQPPSPNVGEEEIGMELDCDEKDGVSVMEGGKDSVGYAPSFIRAPISRIVSCGGGVSKRGYPAPGSRTYS